MVLMVPHGVPSGRYDTYNVIAERLVRYQPAG
jgi:hypothetical protein